MSSPSKTWRKYVSYGLLASGVVGAALWVLMGKFEVEPPEEKLLVSDTTGVGQQIAAGERLFKEEQCLTCHSLYAQGGNIGPDLAYVGRRKPVDWIREHIKDPQKASPGTVMPRFGFLNEEVKAITAYLLWQAERAASPEIHRVGELRTGLTSQGRGVIAFQKFGCELCHGIGGTGGVRNINAHTGDNITGLKFVARAFNRVSLREKILRGVAVVPKADSLGPEPPLFMPAFQGMMTDPELDDLMTYLISLAPPREDDEE